VDALAPLKVARRTFQREIPAPNDLFSFDETAPVPREAKPSLIALAVGLSSGLMSLVPAALAGDDYEITELRKWKCSRQLSVW
jgi:hypothetical protein